MTALEELAQERAKIMERLQEIDDEAAAVIAEQEAERLETRKTWAHLLPKVEVRDLLPGAPPSPYFSPAQQ